MLGYLCCTEIAIKSSIMDKDHRPLGEESVVCYRFSDFLIICFGFMASRFRSLCDVVDLEFRFNISIARALS